MKKIFNVGLIGCGHIAETYFRAHKYFNNFKIIKCADINNKAAIKCAKANRIKAVSIKELLNDKNIKVILNLTMMDPDQAQRAVDFIAGGTYAIDGHQERVGESIFLFAPSCVNVTSSSPEEASPSNVPSKNTPQYNFENNTAPEPAWGNSKLSAYS